jgi:hypothetical protein
MPLKSKPERSVSHEKLLDQALELALKSGSEFCSWFAGKTNAGSGYHKYVISRSNYPWGTARLLLPNSQTGALEMVSRQGETDVLVVLSNDAGQRVGIHIENKLAGGTFTPYQPEVCAARADAWIGKTKYGNYHSWETVLVAPTSFYQRHQSDARKFKAFIAHEELAVKVPSFAR